MTEIVSVHYPENSGRFVDIVNPDDPENPLEGYEACFEYAEGYWIATNFWDTLRAEFPRNLSQERMIEIFLSIHRLVRNDLR